MIVVLSTRITRNVFFFEQETPNFITLYPKIWESADLEIMRCWHVFINSFHAMRYILIRLPSRKHTYMILTPLNPTFM